jgi:hypothetical protein
MAQLIPDPASLVEALRELAADVECSPCDHCPQPASLHRAQALLAEIDSAGARQPTWWIGVEPLP